MDLDISNYLQSLRELNDKRVREDEQLARTLEEDIRKRKSHSANFYSHYNSQYGEEDQDHDSDNSITMSVKSLDLDFNAYKKSILKDDTNSTNDSSIIKRQLTIKRSREVYTKNRRKPSSNLSFNNTFDPNINNINNNKDITNVNLQNYDDAYDEQMLNLLSPIARQLSPSKATQLNIANDGYTNNNVNINKPKINKNKPLPDIFEHSNPIDKDLSYESDKENINYKNNYNNNYNNDNNNNSNNNKNNYNNFNSNYNNDSIDFSNSPLKYQSAYNFDKIENLQKKFDESLSLLKNSQNSQNSFSKQNNSNKNSSNKLQYTIDDLDNLDNLDDLDEIRKKIDNTSFRSNYNETTVLADITSSVLRNSERRENRIKSLDLNLNDNLYPENDLNSNFNKPLTTQTRNEPPNVFFNNSIMKRLQNFSTKTNFDERNFDYQEFLEFKRKNSIKIVPEPSFPLSLSKENRKSTSFTIHSEPAANYYDQNTNNEYINEKPLILPSRIINLSDVESDSESDLENNFNKNNELNQTALKSSSEAKTNGDIEILSIDSSEESSDEKYKINPDSMDLLRKLSQRSAKITSKRKLPSPPPTSNSPSKIELPTKIISNATLNSSLSISESHLNLISKLSKKSEELLGKNNTRSTLGPTPKTSNRNLKSVNNSKKNKPESESSKLLTLLKKHDEKIKMQKKSSFKNINTKIFTPNAPDFKEDVLSNPKPKTAPKKHFIDYNSTPATKAIKEPVSQLKSGSNDFNERRNRFEKIGEPVDLPKTPQTNCKVFVNLKELPKANSDFKSKITSMSASPVRNNGFIAPKMMYRSVSPVKTDSTFNKQNSKFTSNLMNFQSSSLNEFEKSLSSKHQSNKLVSPKSRVKQAMEFYMNSTGNANSISPTMQNKDDLSNLEDKGYLNDDTPDFVARKIINTQKLNNNKLKNNFNSNEDSPFLKKTENQSLDLLQKNNFSNETGISGFTSNNTKPLNIVNPKIINYKYVAHVQKTNEDNDKRNLNQYSPGRSPQAVNSFNTPTKPHSNQIEVINLDDEDDDWSIQEISPPKPTKYKGGFISSAIQKNNSRSASPFKSNSFNKLADISYHDNSIIDTTDTLEVSPLKPKDKGFFIASAIKRTHSSRPSRNNSTVDRYIPMPTAEHALFAVAAAKAPAMKKSTANKLDFSPVDRRTYWGSPSPPKKNLESIAEKNESTKPMKKNVNRADSDEKNDWINSAMHAFPNHTQPSPNRVDSKIPSREASPTRSHIAKFNRMIDQENQEKDWLASALQKSPGKHITSLDELKNLQDTSITQSASKRFGSIKNRINNFNEINKLNEQNEENQENEAEEEVVAIQDQIVDLKAISLKKTNREQNKVLNQNFAIEMPKVSLKKVDKDVKKTTKDFNSDFPPIFAQLKKAPPSPKKVDSIPEALNQINVLRKTSIKKLRENSIPEAITKIKSLKSPKEVEKDYEELPEALEKIEKLKPAAVVEKPKEDDPEALKQLSKIGVNLFSNHIKSKVEKRKSKGSDDGLETILKTSAHKLNKIEGKQKTNETNLDEEVDWVQTARRRKSVIDIDGMVRKDESLEKGPEWVNAALSKRKSYSSIKDFGNKSKEDDNSQSIKWVAAARTRKTLPLATKNDSPSKNFAFEDEENQVEWISKAKSKKSSNDLNHLMQVENKSNNYKKNNEKVDWVDDVKSGKPIANFAKVNDTGLDSFSNNLRSPSSNNSESLISSITSSIFDMDHAMPHNYSMNSFNTSIASNIDFSTSTVDQLLVSPSRIDSIKKNLADFSNRKISKSSLPASTQRILSFRVSGKAGNPYRSDFSNISTIEDDPSNETLDLHDFVR
ncbi:uncharacterized protein ASCRUDRAFT_9079 [Ascoidea rubescens DSM 1968]|uniref:Uncharacterized protein n=1 Tax=Ascoidea rubescens DSM 1968 TaxID=1344418 RepID=A0A1D2VE39_9ASCO|nr:hypothetical protein ASCRUDRAFT_9079 [Ascoidea rubescens DSM 1968]ODV59869.1 hypothetical protein ASCRUDRAFT_9079 [Ascoidea rubescens DSM 1968]